MSKSVNEKVFKECVDQCLSGRMHPDVAAYLTGLSRPTFNKRLNQYYDPDVYGKLPDDFFSEQNCNWKENTGWIKASAAIRRYKEREKEREEHQQFLEDRKRKQDHRNEFLQASKLPRLES